MDTRVGQDQDMDMDLLSTLLAETTLSNTATTPNDLDEDDLWGPQIGSAHIAEDVTVPPEMQIIPDAETRLQLIDLYYKVSIHYIEAVAPEFFFFLSRGHLY